MQIVLTENDLIKLKPSTRADLLANLFPKVQETQSGDAEGFDWDDRVSLTPGQVEEFMPGCSDVVQAGLRVIAEHGPVIHAQLLDQAGIENYGSFQGAVTKRTRTVTGDKHAYLLTWDDWSSEENWNSEKNMAIGHYAVTDGTFRSLRIFFNLD